MIGLRWIDRGPEPAGVAGYAQQYTPGWIDYFQNGIGQRPSDFLWSIFRLALGSRNNNICWYCERQCDAETGGRAPTVDHFRPLSRFPQLAYAWPNWVYSCRRCNEDNKRDNWPDSGYVDPTAVEVAERPERYFDYDAATGEIIPKTGLTTDARQRARQTIRDLGLDKLDVMYDRFVLMNFFIGELLSLPPMDRRAYVDNFTQQPHEYAGVAAMVVDQLQRGGLI
jgi:uncharacterized protein (TIGR02646 family)